MMSSEQKQKVLEDVRGTESKFKKAINKLEKVVIVNPSDTAMSTKLTGLKDWYRLFAHFSDVINEEIEKVKSADDVALLIREVDVECTNFTENLNNIMKDVN